MVAVYPDGQYDHGATWQNANDRVMWERTFTTGTDAMQKMSAAMLLAAPDTPAEVVREVMTRPAAAYSGLVKVSPTIDDVLNIGPSGPVPGHLYDRAPTDFSGTPAGRDGSSTPSLSAY